MIFYTVNKFVEEILGFNPDVRNIIVAYFTRENKQDKFENNTVHPLLLILETDDDKVKMDLDQIQEHFGESIALTLGKETTEKLGVAVCSISTQAKHSKRLNCEYYQRQFLTPGPKIIKELNEINKKREDDKAQVYDI